MRENSRSRKQSVAVQGLSYDRPKIKPFRLEHRKECPANNIPFFLDGDGNVYSFDYVELPSATKYYGQLLAKNPMPKPYDTHFRKYQDYEDGLVEWGKKIEKKMKDLILPEVMGGFYSRPTTYNSTYIDDSISADTDDPITSTSSYTESSFDKDDPPLVSTKETSIPIRPSWTKKGSLGEMDSGKEGESGKESCEAIKIIPPVVNITFDSPRWEAVLVPPEPNPYHYNEYEDYNTAVCSWASLMRDSRSFITPHATQLGSILPLALTLEMGQTDGYKWMPERLPLTSCRSGLPIHSFFDDSVLERGKILETPDHVLHTFYRKTLELEATTMNNLDKYLALWLSHQMRNAQKQGNGKYVLYVHDTYGDTHPSIVLRPGLLVTEEGDGVEYLRRTAIIKEEVKPKIGEKIRSVPVFEFPVNEEKLIVDEEYTRNVTEEYKTLHHRYRNHDLYAWYNPTIVSDKNKAQERSSIRKMMEKEYLTHDDVVKILESPVHPDLFLFAVEPQEDEGKKLFQPLLKKFSYSKLNVLLSLVRNSKDRKLHARISIFLLEAFKYTQFAEQLIPNWLQIENMEYFSILPYILHFFDPVARDIFPYLEDTLTLLKQVLDKKSLEITNFMKYFFKWYYINETRNALKAPKYTDTVNVLLKESKSLAKELTQFLKKENDLLSSFVSLVGHRSRTVSSTFLFIVIQLLKGPETGGSVLDPNTKLFSLMKQLCFSKFQHVKLAVSHLLMFVTENHKDDFKKFLKTNNQFLSFLFETVPIFSETVVNLIIQDLKQWDIGADSTDQSPKGDTNHTKEKISSAWWLDDASFHKILYSIKNMETANVEVAKLVSTMAKTIWSDRTKDRKAGPASVKITTEDLNHICQLSTLSGQHLPPHSSKVATYMVITLRHLIKIPDYFALVNQNVLHSNTTSFLNHPDYQLNREAWRTFYQLIKYNPGLLESWINDGEAKGKVLKTYINALSVASGLNGMGNGIHYVEKILSVDRGKKGKMEKKSSMEVKMLVGYFIAQRLFVSIHMIYQNLNKKMSGPAYHAVIKFYYLLLTYPPLSKLLKDCLKNAQYKGDIDQTASIMRLSAKKTGKERIMWE